MDRYCAEPLEMMEGRRVGARLGWALVVLALVSNGVQVLLALWIAGYRPALAASPWCAAGLIAVGFYGCGLPAFGAMVRRLPKAPVQARGKLTAGQVFHCWLLCMFLAYLCSMLGTALSALADSWMGTSSSNPVEELISMSGMLPTLLAAGICSPIVEEYIFRGLLLRRTLVFGEKAACCFTAAAFGLMHMNLYQFFYAFAIGLVLARVAVYTGSIRTGILLHIGINLSGSVLMPLLEGLPEIGMWLVTAFFLGILLFGGRLCFRWRRLLFSFAPPEEGAGESGLRAVQLWCNSGTVVYLLVCIAGFLYAALAV